MSKSSNLTTSQQLLVNQINLEITKFYPLISNLDYIAKEEFWIYSDIELLSGNDNNDNYFERNFTFMLIILESLGV